MTKNMTTNRLRTCMCTFGLIADIQYADHANGTNHHRDRVRYYRGSLQLVDRAVRHWTQSIPPPAFILQLGDIIDGINNASPGVSERALTTALAAFTDLRGTPIHHLIGNHDLYNFRRDQIQQSALDSSTLPGVDKNPRHPGSMYYHFSATRALRIVVLDTYDISVLGLDKGSDAYMAGYDMLRAVNGNQDVNDSRNLPPDKEQVVAYNGAVSDTQLEWLDHVLGQADAHRENVIVTGHQGIDEACSERPALCWNYDQIMEMLLRHKSCVLAYICGHNHLGGSSRVDGIHIINLPGVIETAPDVDAHATGHVYQDRVEIAGAGRVSSHTLPFKHTYPDTLTM